MTSVTTVPFADVASFTFTPAMPGDDYLVLLTATATEAPGSSGITLLWIDPQGAQWARTIQNPRGAWQSHLLARRATLQGPTTIKIQARSGATASMQYIRVAALRIAGLASFAEQIDTTYRLTTSQTPVLANELLPSPLPPAPQYVVFGTMALDDDCTNTMFNGRRVQFSVDAVTFFPGNCAYQTTQGYLGLQQTAPASVTASYSSVTGENVAHVESALFVLGVR